MLALEYSLLVMHSVYSLFFFFYSILISSNLFSDDTCPTNGMSLGMSTGMPWLLTAVNQPNSINRPIATASSFFGISVSAESSSNVAGLSPANAVLNTPPCRLGSVWRLQHATSACQTPRNFHPLRFFTSNLYLLFCVAGHFHHCKALLESLSLRCGGSNFFQSEILQGISASCPASKIVSPDTDGQATNR